VRPAAASSSTLICLKVAQSTLILAIWIEMNTEVGATLGDLLQVGTSFDPSTVVLSTLVFVTADGEVSMEGHRGETAAAPSRSDLSTRHWWLRCRWRY